MQRNLAVGLLATIALLVPVPGRAQAGSGTITGTVTAEAGVPLPGASVSVTGTRISAVAGTDGRFTLSGVPAGPQQLRATHLGYGEVTRSVTVTAGGTTTANLELHASAVQLEGVVAVGYGTQRRRDVTGAIASVSPKALEQAASPSIGEVLQGQVPGVQVTQNSSAPGGGFSMRIRGSGSLTSSNEPLYVVDGIPVSSSEVTPSGGGIIGGQQPPSALSFLNPNDIESIQVLKDASATAIYGSRGANGVVIITTKQGHAGRTVVEVESSYGVQQIARRYDLLNAQQYGAFADDVYGMQGSSAVPFPNPAQLGSGTDWQGLILRTAPVMQENLVIRGGVGQDTRFALSGGYADEQGIIRRTGFKRYTFRGNLEHNLSSRLTVGSNFSATRTATAAGNAADGMGDEGSSAMQAALISWPFLPVYGEDGSYLYMDRDVPANLSSLGWVAGQNYENPVAAINEVTNDFQDDRVLGNAYAEYEILDGLHLRLNGGADVLHSGRNAYFTRLTRAGGSGKNGVAQTGTVDRSNYLAESILRYNRSMGGLSNLEATTGFSYESHDYFSRSIANQNFATDHLSYYGIETGTALGGPTVGAGSASSTLASFFGRVNYDAAGKYLLTVTGRYDGSSKFGAGNKWGFFPSAALGWRISQERFLQNVDWLSDLKLRVSYGITGNQEIGTYQSLARLGADEAVIGEAKVVGFYPSAISNPDLRWERSRMLDAGFDMGLFDNRVSLTFDAYRKTTDDLLYSIPLPRELGFGSVLMNTGSIQNRGVELGLNADLVDGDRFGWSVGANVAANRNEVLDIGGETTQFFGPDLTWSGSFPGKQGNLVREGSPLGVFYGYEVAGIFRTQEEADGYVGPDGSPIQPGALAGQPRYVDVNGDGRITSADRTILGNPEPDFTFGLNNDFRYGNLSLHGFFQGSYGNDVYNMMLNLLAPEYADLRGNLYAPRYLDAWSPENPGGSWPRLSVPSGQGYRGPGDIRDLYIEDGSYLRLKSLMLSYELPADLARRLIGGSRTARIYVDGENLVTWTKYSGINPDVNSRGGDNVNRGIDFGAYPLPRTYRVGIRLGL